MSKCLMCNKEIDGTKDKYFELKTFKGTKLLNSVIFCSVKCLSKDIIWVR